MSKYPIKRKIDFKVRDYMKENLTLNEIKHLIENLKSDLKEIIRDKKLFNTADIINKVELSNHLLNFQKICKDLFFLMEKIILFVDRQN